MGAISLPTPSRLYYAPQVEIWIGGNLRSDARIDTLVQSSGIEAAVTQIEFLGYRREAAPCRPMDRVVIYFDRHLDARPKFVGVIVGSPQETFDPEGGPRLVYSAVDLRHYLHDDVCDRDYNAVSKIDGRLAERLTSRQIVVDLYEQYKAHQEGISGRSALDILGLELSRFPDQPVPEFRCKGNPHGEALQRLVEGLGDGSYRLELRYQANGSATLSCFKTGQGFAQRVVVGTDPAVSPYAQAHGVANVRGGSTSADSTKIVNEVICESPHHLRETAIPLGPLFDVGALDALAANLLGASVPPSDSVQNPSYDPAASQFGRVYAIPPQVDADGVERRLAVESSLLQFGADERYPSDRPRGPALIYRFGASGDWIAAQKGFRIVDHQRVELDAPLLETIPASDTVTSRPVDRVAYLGSIDARSLPSGQVALFWRTTSSFFEDGLNLAPWANGEKEVRTAGSGGGVALTPVPQGPGLEEEIEGKVFISAATGHIWLPIRRMANPFAAEAEIAGIYALAAVGLWPDHAEVYLRDTRAVDPEAPAETLAIPTEIYLQAAFRSEVPLQGSSGKQGDSRAHVRRVSTAGAEAKHLGTHFFRLEATAANFGSWSVTQEAWSAPNAWTAGDGATVFRDDSPVLVREARNQARTAATARETITRELPAMPTLYEIGALLYENNRSRGVNIINISYDLRALRTRLTASNQ